MVVMGLAPPELWSMCQVIEEAFCEAHIKACINDVCDYAKTLASH